MFDLRRRHNKICVALYKSDSVHPIEYLSIDFLKISTFKILFTFKVTNYK